MSAWEEAVRAVAHDADCDRTQVGWLRVPMECKCTRDARIAKGIEAAVAEAFHRGFYEDFSESVDEMNASLDTAALTAFKEAR